MLYGVTESAFEFTVYVALLKLDDVKPLILVKSYEELPLIPVILQASFAVAENVVFSPALT